MEVLSIDWSDSFVSQTCWLNVHQMKESQRMDDIRKEADDGCLQCVLVCHACSRYELGYDLDVFVKREDNGLLWVMGTDKKSGLSHKDVTYQLYYPVGTPQPEWKFVKPGRTSPRSRREEYKQRINDWIGNCNSSHSTCTVKDAELPHRVLFVGDEGNSNIYLHISEHQIAPYVALSHCWGGSHVLQTTKENVKDHINSISFQSLPMNFQDAITITRSIGLQYLWIDSLCIVQDDKADWEIESSKMASIYNEAYVVLAASQAAESSDGFLERKDVEFENAQQLNPGNSVKVSLIKNPDSSVSEIYSRPISFDPTMGKSGHRWRIDASPLNQRGWVLQENILARRIIHFTDSEMIWECVQCFKCECMEIEADEAEATHWSGFNVVRNARNGSMQGKGYMETPTSEFLYIQWRKLIDVYGRLILTQDTDRLPALSGLAKLCQSHGTGKYLAGIWENDLMESLVWRRRSDGTVQRWSEYMAPSWSPFSVGYIKGYDGPIEAGYYYSQGDVYQKNGMEQQAHVLESQCTPVGSDPTGAVKDGYLVLRGPMRRTDHDGPDHSWTVTKGSCSLTATVWDHVYWDNPLEELDGCKEVDRSEVVFFLLCANFDMGYFKALCLLPLSERPGTYRRVALLDPHWGQPRMARFFRNAEEGTVKII